MTTIQNNTTQNSRERILNTALELFALNGFSKTSTRQIAELAQVNLSSIKYYFGDKQGLYKAAFTEPVKNNKHELVSILDSNEMEIGLKLFFLSFLSPLSKNKNIQLCVKIHMRELFEPTHVNTSEKANEVDNDIKPYHRALTKILIKELEVEKSDNDIDRLAFSLISMAVFLYFANDIITQVNSSLLDSEESLNEWSDRISMYALAMINAEKKRRYDL